MDNKQMNPGQVNRNAQPQQRPPQGYAQQPQQRVPQGYPQQPQQRVPQGYPQQSQQRVPQGYAQQPQQRPPQGYAQQPQQRPPQGYPQQPQQRPPQGYPQQPQQRPPQGYPQQQQQMPQQSYEQPQNPQQGFQQPGMNPQQPVYVQVASAMNLKTNRSLLKYILLAPITLGIYPLVVMSGVSTDINTIASRYDGKKTMHYCLVFFIFSWLTLGILPIVWMHNLCSRIGNEVKRRGIDMDFGAKDFWLWGVLGALIIVGPFIFMYKLLKAMNLLSEDFNKNGF